MGNGFIALLTLVILLSSVAQAADSQTELRDLYTGTRAMAMGNAFVGLADDEEAIFYNPAGMAGNKGYGVSADEQISVSDDTISLTKESIAAFKNLTGNSLNVLMGKDIFLHSQFSPSFTMPNFGIALLVDDQLAAITRNQALPQVDLGAQFTNGIQTAFGFSLLDQGRHADTNSQDLRVGFGLKYMWRRGGYEPLSLTQIVSLSPTEAQQIYGNYQGAFGGDLGIQYIRVINPKFKVGAGAAFTNIGNMNFGGQADPQDEDLSAGLFAQYSPTKLTRFTMTYDLHNLNDNIPFGLQNHFGVEYKMPIFSVQAGVNQTSLTYGAGVDLWIIQIQALSYAVEEGAYPGIDSMRTYAAQISIKLGI